MDTNKKNPETYASVKSYFHYFAGAQGGPEDLRAYQQTLAQKLNIPVIRPMEEGVGGLLPVIRRFMAYDHSSH